MSNLTFQPINWNPELVYSAADLNLYYDVEHPLWYKRPDWFGVVGVPKLYKGEDLRLSYVTWQEPANPFVIVELLSPGTENLQKKLLQQQNVRFLLNRKLGMLNKKQNKPKEKPKFWQNGYDN